MGKTYWPAGWVYFLAIFFLVWFAASLFHVFDVRETVSSLVYTAFMCLVPLFGVLLWIPCCACRVKVDYDQSTVFYLTKKIGVQRESVESYLVYGAVNHTVRVYLRDGEHVDFPGVRFMSQNASYSRDLARFLAGIPENTERTGTDSPRLMLGTFVFIVVVLALFGLLFGTSFSAKYLPWVIGGFLVMVLGVALMILTSENLNYQIRSGYLERQSILGMKRVLLEDIYRVVEVEHQTEEGVSTFFLLVEHTKGKFEISEFHVNYNRLKRRLLPLNRIRR